MKRVIMCFQLGFGRNGGALQSGAFHRKGNTRYG